MHHHTGFSVHLQKHSFIVAADKSTALIIESNVLGIASVANGKFPHQGKIIGRVVDADQVGAPAPHDINQTIVVASHGVTGNNCQLT